MNNPNHLSKAVLNKISELGSKHKLPFFNCHTHIFNFDQVHDKFLKGLIPWWIRGIIVLLDLLLISLLFLIPAKPLLWILLIALLLLMLFLTFAVFSLTIKIHKLIKKDIFRIIVWTMKKLIPREYDALERYAHFILHSYDFKNRDVKSQEKIFNEMQSYYPEDTKFIVLSMDLDYMIHCDIPREESNYFTQLKELLDIKKDYTHTIYPFIHADPRRLADVKGDYFEFLKENIQNEKFRGIKIYPPLGYFPFDRRLKPVYDLAYENNIPIMVHCSIGPVYYRGKIKTLRDDGYFKDGIFIHPFTKNELLGKQPKSFTPHYTHPLNYYCLMNEPEKLFNYWKECESQEKFKKYPSFLKNDKYTAKDLEKYRELKICLGHYGSSEEWMRYLKDPWIPTGKNSLTVNKHLFHESKGMWKYNEHNSKLKDIKAYSWYSIITDMLTLKDDNKQLVFPNLYADISYNLSNEEMLPLLKVRLDNNEILANKILFGTDFYMVSMNATEREITLKLRSFIGEENFKQIAVINPLNYLTMKKTITADLLESAKTP